MPDAATLTVSAQLSDPPGDLALRALGGGDPQAVAARRPGGPELEERRSGAAASRQRGT